MIKFIFFGLRLLISFIFLQNRKELLISRMFIKENDNLYDKIDYMKRMSGFENKRQSIQDEKIKQAEEEDEMIMNEEDEDEKELVEINFVNFARRQKDTDLLRRPRLFILPNVEKLKDMIKECINQIIIGGNFKQLNLP